MTVTKVIPKIRDQHISMVLKEIKAVGGVVDRIDRNKHWKVYWSVHGRKLIYVTAVSSVSVRGTWKAVSDIRRHARGATA